MSESYDIIVQVSGVTFNRFDLLMTTVAGAKAREAFTRNLSLPSEGVLWGFAPQGFARTARLGHARVVCSEGVDNWDVMVALASLVMPDPPPEILARATTLFARGAVVLL